ncbi:unnamed protein product [Musa acuminata subsp. malaccensis]|uniref:(wild Malaysian banana) hypothetical protein n=1 Tax=Musa acuminata subsp. malaccensis TaxID=214687 RepID=A0A804HSZ8_MUSAM|nr:PREDICTED: protein MODIFIER OF SNC1 1-like [Musa acuminata subsp. malaccensis]XP_009413073.1 PREDICTED: protein MODIFIER OF SNC1 1-like [Musa acuminata subsp. malaccensis]XP_018683031.1 PREDICTED: protein MODIFIER OF SNC1 1-like [Musa acuminata subsp. malaccensis]CAG1859255.1 unnamed protein product [Musa acuminata subsp. malaccensis]
MASNTLSGDRRWASARKSGMTILGKVPKPINLPSQRLENNGLDPNVEIVPKGTLTWGSRSSSATPNVWSSSTLLSPKTDGSTGSPSHYSGRPSSGSGTRPSTAGSDRSQDPSPNAWGSNSRPSTASGLLPSNQTPIVSARPRSAETRPGSSQLSRFAENSSESAVAWGATRTAEKLGVGSSKTDEFSLSSGDFPTLGSEKKSESHSPQGHNSQSPSAAASGASRPNEKLELPASGDSFVDNENASTFRTERNSYVEGGGGALLNQKWLNNPQQTQPYQSSKVTSHQFNSWHRPSGQHPDGVWYRGGAVGGPYRPAGPPGCFPVDPFTYCQRPFQPNSEAIPRPGTGSGTYHPTNGETYRPQVVPNSYMFPSHSLIPARPGPYQALGPYDGYHNYHQASFCSSGEQQIPSTEVSTRPNLYDEHPNHNNNLTSVEFLNIPGRDDSQLTKEPILSDRACVPHQGHYKVLLKPHDDLKDNHPQGKGQYGSSSPRHFDLEFKPGDSNSKEGELSIAGGKNETTKSVTLTDCQAPTELVGNHEDQLSKVGANNLGKNKCRTSDGLLRREPGITIPVVQDQKHYPIMRKNSALIEKIEGLNNKVRNADNLDVGQLPLRKEQTKQQKFANAKTERPAQATFSDAAPTENASTSSVTPMSVSFEGSSINGPISSTMVMPVSFDGGSINVINNSNEFIDSAVVPGTSEYQDFALMKPDSLIPGEAVYSHVPKRIISTRRNNYQAKPLLDNQVDGGLTRESSGRDSSVIPVEKKVADGPVSGILDNHSSKETVLTSSSDLLDHRAQRAKLKEIAAQRAKQLKEEEEERTREQKAKALAKLEELNRRSAAQSMNQKLNDAFSTRKSVQHQEESRTDIAQTDALTGNPPGGVLVENADIFLQAGDCDNKEHGTSIALPLNTVSHPSSLGHETNTTEMTTHNIGSQSHVSVGSKHKQMGHRRRQKVPLEKSLGEKPMMENVGSKCLDEVVQERSPDEKPVTAENKESPEIIDEVNTPAPDSAMLQHNGDPSLQHKKKNSRNSRNKNKDEPLMTSSLSFSAHSHENVEERLSESSKSHLPASITVTSSVLAQVSPENSGSQDSRDGVVHSNQGCSNIIEEVHGRLNNQWKPQPPRRPARSQQIVRNMDKVHGSETVVWAPIKPANKNEQPEESSQSSMMGSNYESSQRNEHDLHNGMRTRRAEIERYVPKPVAKEILQHENTRKSSSYVNQSATGDMPNESYTDSKGVRIGKFDGSEPRSTDFFSNTNGEDNKPSKRGRAHATWRQRSSSESTLPLQNSNESLSSSDTSKLFNRPSGQHQLLPEQVKSDGWESRNDSLVKDSGVLPAVIKDQGVTSRQRNQQVHRPRGRNYVTTPDHQYLQHGMDDKAGVGSPILDINETDTRNSTKDNKNAITEHIRTQSHWKPKSQTYSHNQQQGTTGSGSQRNPSHDGRSEKFTSPGFESNSSYNENDSALTEKDHVVTDAGHKDSIRTETGASSSDPSKEQIHIPKPDVPIDTALPPENMNAQRHGHRGGRFNRGQEATYRIRDSMLTSGRSNVQKNGDKRKNNSHLGYQPVGSYNKPSDIRQLDSHIDQEAQSHHASRQRYKERVQTQTRNPGHFVRRDSGATAHVNDSCNSEE